MEFLGIEFVEYRRPLVGLQPVAKNELSLKHRFDDDSCSYMQMVVASNCLAAKFGEAFPEASIKSKRSSLATINVGLAVALTGVILRNGGF